MTDQDELRRLQSEGRQKLRDLEVERERRRREAADSKTNLAARRTERKVHRREEWAQIRVQAVGTVLGGVVLALGGVAVGLLQSTPTAQLVSAITVVAIFVISGLGAAFVKRSADNADRMSEALAKSMRHDQEVAKITRDYRLGEDPSSF